MLAKCLQKMGESNSGKGVKGAQARAQVLSPEARSEIASRAARTRWSKGHSMDKPQPYSISFLSPRYSTYQYQVAKGQSETRYMYQLTVVCTGAPIRHITGVRLVAGVLRPPATRRSRGGYRNVVAWSLEGALDLARAVRDRLPELRDALGPSRRGMETGNLEDARKAMQVPSVVEAAKGLVEESFDLSTRLASLYEGDDQDALAAKLRYAEVGAADRPDADAMIRGAR